MEKKYNGSCKREAGIKFWKNRYLIETVVGQVEAIAFNIIKVFQGRVIKSLHFEQGFLKGLFQIFMS
jgi:hypothetical protein